MSQALHVPYEQAFFYRTSSQLSRSCDHPVDVQDLGVPGSSPIFAYRRAQEALSLNPDVVLFLVVPYDLNRHDVPVELADHGNPTKGVEHLLIHSRAVLIAQHFMFLNKEAFVRAYLLYGDKADYLRQPITPAWQQRFADIDLIIGELADTLRATRVPLIVIPVPSRAEAALLSSSQLPPRVDPFAFGREIEGIAAKHGAGYLDLMKPPQPHPQCRKLVLRCGRPRHC